MCARSKGTTTCAEFVVQRQYVLCSDFNEQIQSKLDLCVRTVKHGYFAARSHGMIYSLKFDPAGAYLVATCSGNSFFLYDPRFNRVVSSNPCAHEDGVNCVTFLAPGRFATGSDDGRVALWDARKVTAPVKLLQGHAYSVKNIEYDERSNRLFTVGFDEQVLSWYLDGTSEEVSDEFDIIIRLPQICRLRLAPDGTKLLLTTRYNCLMIINSFDGLNIVKDMYNSFGVMNKIAKSFYPNTANHSTKVLQRDESQFITRKRNAVSFHLAPPPYSSVLSVCFHPNNKLIAYRSLQRRNFIAYDYESTCIYDVRDSHTQCHSELGQYYSDFPERRMLAIKKHEIYAHDFIKEICFSPDGRLIAAPLSNTVQLLAASAECPNIDLHFQKLNQDTSLPSKLCDLQCPLIAHKNPVLCCTFAPRDVLLATGCMDGEIYIHQPVL